MTNISSAVRRSNAIYVVSHNRDSGSSLERWENSYRPIQRDGYLICNNREVWEHHERLPRTCNISNGYDFDDWGCDVPMANRKRQIFWTGSTNPRKDKGYDKYLKPMVPLLKQRGFDLLLHGFPTGGNLQEWAWPTEKMRRTYNESFAVVCASTGEGSPNYFAEGMICGAVGVTTRVGNALEFGVDRENVVFCDRTIPALIAGIEYAWEHRERLSAAGRATMDSWKYSGPDGRAQTFFALFRALIAGRVPAPFSYQDTHWSEI